jgi:hypothetical protein
VIDEAVARLSRVLLESLPLIPTGACVLFGFFAQPSDSHPVGELGDVPLGGGVSRHRAGQCSDHAVMSSGLATSSVFFSASWAMERSER